MPLIPEGKYIARPITQSTAQGELLAVFGKSSKKGTPQVTVAFKLGEGTDHVGDTVYWTGYFTDGALKNTMRALRNCGFVGDDLDTFNDQDPLTTMRSVELDISHEEGQNGKVYSRVQWVNRPRASMDRAEMRSFAAEMKEKLAQFTDDSAPPEPLDDEDDRIAF